MESNRFISDGKSDTIKINDNGLIAVNDNGRGFVYLNKIIRKNSISCNYLEFRILSHPTFGDDQCVICLGFTDPSYTYTNGYALGWDEGSYAYHSDDGNCFDCGDYEELGLPTWMNGDVIGCGVDLNTWEIFYTKNGGFLGYVIKVVDSIEWLQFACVIHGGIGKIQILDENSFLYSGPEIKYLSSIPSYSGFSYKLKHVDVRLSEGGFRATATSNNTVDDQDSVRVVYLNASFRKRTAKQEQDAGQCNYFELSVVQLPKNGVIGLGFADAGRFSYYQTDRMVGWDEGSYGYHSDDGGYFMCQGSSAEAIQFGLPTYTTGDIIGFGLNVKTWQIFLTKNGKFLQILPPIIGPFLKPVIVTKYLTNSQAVIHVNDGLQPFLYTGPEVMNSNIAELLETAKKGTKPWNHSKIMIVGEGRAGKTALANSIIGRSFQETESTVGINQFSCDVKYAGVGEQGQWGEYQKPEKELEAALALMLIEARNKKLNAASINIVVDKKDLAKNKVANDLPTLTATQPQRNEPSSLLTVVSLKQEDIDNELVMKCVADSIKTETKLIMSVFDYGGQSVFNVIHHFFLTQYGIYLVVFNMEWFVTNDPNIKKRGLSYLNFWLNSIVVHTWNNDTMETAPIVLVGTRKDIVKDPSQHVAISTFLFESFNASLAWPSVIEYKAGNGPNGRTTLSFFPVDNKLGREDINLKSLLSIVEAKLMGSSYVHEEKPLSWLQTFDKFMKDSNCHLTYKHAETLAESSGIPLNEVPSFLRFLHEMGYLMWHEEETLRDIIIIDAVSYFVNPITEIICKHTPTSDDPTHHLSDTQIQCRKSLPQDWLMMTSKGLLTEKLLVMLLSKYNDRLDIIKKLMIKFGLLIALLSESDGIHETALHTGVELSNLNILPGSISKHKIDSVDFKHYLVPALLPESKITEKWSDESFSTCFFIVTSTNLHQYSTVTLEDLKSLGFLPRGLFERLIGKVVAWCQNSVLHRNIHDQDLYQDEVILSFSSQRFRLKVWQDINCIELNIEGKNPLLIHSFIENQIKKIISECMKSLRFFTSLLFVENSFENPAFSIQRAENLFIPLEEIYGVVRNQSILQRRGGRKLLTSKEVSSLYGTWIPDRSLRDSYDIFISYRWGVYDSNFAIKLFEFSNYNVGEENKAVDVFLDKERLQDGRQFQSDFAKALFNSLIVVPILSYDSLVRMLEHNPMSEDNLIIEWVLSLEFCNNEKSRVCRIFPIAFGRRLGDFGESIGDLFAEQILERLPKVVPATSLKVAGQFMRSFGIEPSNDFYDMTVFEILQKLKKFQCFPTWHSNNAYSLLEIECAKSIEKVLRHIPDIGNHNIKKQELLVTSATFNTNTNSPGAIAKRTLKQLIDDIKIQFGIEDTNNVNIILKNVSDNLLVGDSLDEYNKLTSIIEKATYIAKELGIPT